MDERPTDTKHDGKGPTPPPRRWVWVAGAGGALLALGASMLTLSSRQLAAPVAMDDQGVDGVERSASKATERTIDPGSSPEESDGRPGFDDGKRESAQVPLMPPGQAPARKAAAGKLACPPGDPLCSDDRGKVAASAAPPPPAATMLPTTPTMRTATGAADRLEASGEVAIDPNGRFATTYRPGGGHLSAFEAAVGQGLVPGGDRELVSDVGARYAPSMDAPKAKALAVKLDWERGKVQPGGGPAHLRLALRSSAQAAARPHLSVHLVLDVSGSMAGKSMEDARQAAAALVDKLAPTDDFSLVTFSTEARVAVEDGAVGSRREHIKKVIAGIHEEGGTNIGEGLTKGYAQAHAAGIPADAVRVVMLLSDGRANEGIVQPSRLSKLALDAFQEGVQTSTFGLGADYDSALMSAIAGDGAGGYYYLRDSEQIAPALGTEVDRRLDPVATAVEVRVRLKSDVELLKVYGSRRLGQDEAAAVRKQELAADSQAQTRDKIKTNRAVDQEGGMRFFIPAFARDDAHALLLRVRVPAAVGSKAVALVELKYKDRLGKKNVSEEIPVAIEYAGSDALSAATIEPQVARTVQGFEAGEALAQAALLMNQGQREPAARLLEEREGILRQAAASLSEPLFLRDADRLGRLRGMAQGSTGDPLVVAMLLETSSRVHLR